MSENNDAETEAAFKRSHTFGNPGEKHNQVGPLNDNNRNDIATTRKEKTDIKTEHTPRKAKYPENKIIIKSCNHPSRKSAIEDEKGGEDTSNMGTTDSVEDITRAEVTDYCRAVQMQGNKQMLDQSCQTDCTENNQETNTDRIIVYQEQLPQHELRRKTKIVTSSERSNLLRAFISDYFEKRKHRIASDELLRRTFGRPLLRIKIDKRRAFNEDDEFVSDIPVPLWINTEDEDCIRRVLESMGFQFLCRSDNCFFFGVGSRSRDEVNAEINNIQGVLKIVCFSRFFRRSVNGSRIEYPEDLVISFNFGEIDSHTWRVCHLHMYSTNIATLNLRPLLGMVSLQDYLRFMLLVLLFAFFQTCGP